MNLKKALIFGITGQDGAYLAKILIDKKYKVYGISRKKNYVNLKKLGILKNTKIFNFLSFSNNKIENILRKKFDEIYYLGGQSSVSVSFKRSFETYESQVAPLKLILNFILNQKNKKTKFLYAGSSEMFGNINKQNKISENSPKKPVSPYGMSKLIGYEIIRSYRLTFKLPVCTAILFNHESSLRTNNYIIKKIINYAKKINFSKNKILEVGNINIKRDWGWGPEYMIGCNKILKSKKIDDYIIASGKTVSLKKIIYLIFKQYNLNWKSFTKVNKKYIRKFEIFENYSNNKKIKKQINWSPKIIYTQVVKKMSE